MALAELTEKAPTASKKDTVVGVNTWEHRLLETYLRQYLPNTEIEAVIGTPSVKRGQEQNNLANIESKSKRRGDKTRLTPLQAGSHLLSERKKLDGVIAEINNRPLSADIKTTKPTILEKSIEGVKGVNRTIQVGVYFPFTEVEDNNTDSIEFRAYIQYQKPEFGLAQDNSTTLLVWDKKLLKTKPYRLEIPVSKAVPSAAEFQLVLRVLNQQTGEVRQKVIPRSAMIAA